MSFHASLEAAYTDGIQPAVTECGFTPVRIDLVEHNEKICDKILADPQLHPQIKAVAENIKKVATAASQKK